MKVTIKTPFGKMSFEMDQNHALLLIRNAAEFATESEEVAAMEAVNLGMVLDGVKVNGPALPVEELPEEKPARVPEIPTTPVPTETRPSTDKVLRSFVPETTIKPDAPKKRSETMFGAKETWDMPAKEEPRRETPKPTWCGFLYVRCEECGTERGYHAKVPTSYHRCACGHETELKDMRPANVKCECGGSFYYKTNIRDRSFTINCINCGTPVDLEQNQTGAYNPMR